VCGERPQPMPKTVSGPGRGSPLVGRMGQERPSSIDLNVVAECRAGGSLRRVMSGMLRKG
jgi:hypothetical protein